MGSVATFILGCKKMNPLNLFSKKSATSSPETPAPRAFPRPQGAPQARSILDAADTGRLSDSWSTAHDPIDRVITRNWETVSARAQSEVLSGAHARAFANMARDNIAGEHGFTLQPQITDADGIPDKAANTAVFDAWENWSLPENCSVSGRESLAQFSRLAVMSWCVYGEAIFIIRRGKGFSEYGFALQNIDPRRLYVGQNEELRNGNVIKHGIEMNEFGRPVAYYFRKNLSKVENCSFTFGDYDRVSAKDVVHFYLKEFPGQTRGLSPLSPVLSDLHRANMLDRSMLARANIASNTLGLVSNSDEPPPEGFEEHRSEAGMLLDIGNKEFIQSGIDYPDSAYEAFQRAILRRIASGLGVSYNNLASDLTNVNFSSIRQGLINERTAWEALQGEFITQMIRPIYRAWLEFSLTAGKIRTGAGAPVPPTRQEKFSAVKFVGRRWTWIDPVNDMTAAEKALNMKIKSRSRIIRDLGGDPWSEWAEIAEENEEMKALGINPAFNAPGAAPNTSLDETN